jgi:hypothetical protein
MFRIPRENPKGVILLQHPLTVNSRIYMSQGYNSLGKCLGLLFVSCHLYFPLILIDILMKSFCSAFFIYVCIL